MKSRTRVMACLRMVETKAVGRGETRVPPAKRTKGSMKGEWWLKWLNCVTNMMA